MEDKEKKIPELFQKETTRRGFLRGTAIAAGSAVAMATVGGGLPKLLMPRPHHLHLRKRT